MKELNDILSKLVFGKGNIVEAHDKIQFNMMVHSLEFATWLQDNYSMNKEQGNKEMLPKGLWRKDFTNDVFDITNLYNEFNNI